MQNDLFCSCTKFFLLQGAFQMRDRGIPVDFPGSFLINQLSIGGKHWIKIQRSKEPMVADVESDINTELYDFLCGVVFS